MKFKVIKFPGEKTTYIAPTWDEMNQLAFEISQKIIQDEKKIDRIATLAKGGWPMTRSMVDFLSIEKVVSFGVKFYQQINRRLDKPYIYQDIPERISGENVLLFDDVADTGKSLDFARDYLINHGAKSVTLATLFYKPHSTVRPDYYAAETSAWIIFPYEAVDAIKVLRQKWQRQGFKTKEIKKRFEQLGINYAYAKLIPKGGEIE